jgi:hypothetical protein
MKIILLLSAAVVLILAAKLRKMNTSFLGTKANGIEKTVKQ